VSDARLPEPPPNESSMDNFARFERAAIWLLVSMLAVGALGFVYLATGGDRRWAPNLFPPRESPSTRSSR